MSISQRKSDWVGRVERGSHKYNFSSQIRSQSLEIRGFWNDKHDLDPARSGKLWTSRSCDLQRLFLRKVYDSMYIPRTSVYNA